MSLTSSASGPVVIGLDLDNTLVGYDELLCELAVSEGYLSPAPLSAPLGLGKRALRDRLRAEGNEGEQEWRKLQALIYGQHMPRARVMPGVAEFLARAAALRPGLGAELQLYVVSHKTRTANNYSDGADFHAAALAFLQGHGFFAPGTGLEPARVFFEPTRAAKVARIAALGCTHFVDDLEETFAEPAFPAGTVRILYDPAGDAAGQPGVVRLGSWASIADALLADLEAGTVAPACPDFSPLAKEAVAVCERIYGGRNSRVYRVRTETGREFAGKHYHQHKDDPRDRLGAEWRALSLLSSRPWLASFVARPQARLTGEGLALYSFLAGSQASLSPATEADMTACLDFLCALHELSRELPAAHAAEIPPASEACFSLAALEANLRARLAALQAVPAEACLGADLAEFLSSELAPFLESSLVRAAGILGAANREPGAELPHGLRTLSPSDFGLHNALRTASGLSFVDFEYFGWDDPAKTLCDFVLHPAMGLAANLRRRFAAGFLERFSQGDAGLRERAAAVYPLYAIKWSLILLNEFLRGADARRQFAAGGACLDDDAARRGAQLKKARKMLEQARSNDATDGLC